LGLLSLTWRTIRVEGSDRLSFLRNGNSCARLKDGNAWQATTKPTSVGGTN
jgi:hypothetical protein